MKKPQLPLKFIDPLFEKVGALSRLHRILICAGAFLLLVGGFAWFVIKPGYEKIDKLTEENRQLETRLNLTRRKARDLEKFKKKMKEEEITFLIAMRQLPDSKEIPSLLTNISRSGKDARLSFLLFQPKPEVNKGFYSEIPVKMAVNGSYHNVAVFFDTVSRMGRIVNIRDITMRAQSGGSKLKTECTAVTYRFLESLPPAK